MNKFNQIKSDKKTKMENERAGKGMERDMKEGVTETQVVEIEDVVKGQKR